MHVGRGPLAVSNSRCESASARVVGCDQWTSESLNGGSWLVINRVISRVTILITHIGGLITPLITTHEPPSRVCRVYSL